MNLTHPLHHGPRSMMNLTVKHNKEVRQMEFDLIIDTVKVGPAQLLNPTTLDPADSLRAAYKFVSGMRWILVRTKNRDELVNSDHISRIWQNTD